MKLRKPMLAITTASTLMLSSCANIDMKEHGAMLGAVMGAAAGAAVCDGNNRLRCAGAGALVGGVAGHLLSQYLTEQDKIERQAALDKALEEKQSTTWTNSESGNAGTIQVKAAPPKSAPQPVKVLKGRLQTPPPLETVASPQRIAKTVNLRGGPGTDYQVVDSFKSGATVDVLGKVQGSDWHLVGHHKVGSGYVFGKFLEPIPATQVAAVEASLPAIPEAQVEEASVQVAMDCVSVEESISLANGRQGTEQKVLCKGPNGWEQV